MEELNNSIINFTKIVKLIKADISSTQIEYTENDSVFAKIIVNKLHDYDMPDEVIVGLLGASNNGKSSFLGVLTFDIKDDGDGLARSNILKHDHEKQNGMTSSIKYEIIGIDDENYINYNSHFVYSWEYIIKNSNSIINFVDLPGSYKYIKTTLFGLMAHRPDHILIFSSLIDTDQENINTTKLHISLCQKLEIPYTIICTKKDLASSTILNKLKTQKDTISISNVTGEGIDDVKELLKNINVENKVTVKDTKSTEFVINEIIIVPDIGTVLTGILKQGRIKIGDTLLLGPCDNTFYTVSVTSIHKKQIPSEYLYCGELGTIIIQSKKINITKHMMLITQDQMPYFKKEFNFAVDNAEGIFPGSKYMAFCRNIYDSVTIEKIQGNILSAKFSKIQYIKSGEFIILKKHDKLIFGKITRI